MVGHRFTATIIQRANSVLSSWDRFFFTPADPLPLSILRLLAGGMLLYTHWVWGRALEQFFGLPGWSDRALLHSLTGPGYAPSLWWYVPGEWLLMVHWLCNFVLLLFVLGCGGRWIGWLTWCIAVSYAQRTSLANFGLDQLNCILVLYLSIGRSTEYLSIDRVVANYLGRPDALNRSTVSANVAMRLIQLNLCIIYLWAGLGKLQGEAWWTGQAIWLAIANYEYQSYSLTWLANFPRLLELMTHLTILWELSFVCLVWPRATRWPILLIGMSMHVGIGAFLGMWTFGLIMIFAYMAFADAEWLRQMVPFSRQADNFPRSAQSSGDEICHSAGMSSQLEFMPPREQESKAEMAEPTKVSSAVIPSVDATLPEEVSQVVGPLNPACALHASQTVAGPTVVLISKCDRTINHFVQLNLGASVNWISVPSIRQAQELRRELPEALYLLLELRTVPGTIRIEYLSVRLVESAKDRSRQSDSSSQRSSKPK